MLEIIRNRKISPATRGVNSDRYKIDCKQVSNEDSLTVNIYFKSQPAVLIGTFKFNGADVAHKNSIHFSVKGSGEIIWSGTQPITAKSGIAKSKLVELLEKGGYGG